MLQPSAEPIRSPQGVPANETVGNGSQGSQDRARARARSLVERVREKIASLGCDRVWVRGAGSQVLLGLRGQDAYARVTPVRDSLFGLAFRAEPGVADTEAGAQASVAWHPLLLVDALEDVVEHALIAEGAVPVQA